MMATTRFRERLLWAVLGALWAGRRRRWPRMAGNLRQWARDSLRSAPASGRPIARSHGTRAAHTRHARASAVHLQPRPVSPNWPSSWRVPAIGRTTVVVLVRPGVSQAIGKRQSVVERQRDPGCEPSVRDDGRPSRPAALERQDIRPGPSLRRRWAVALQRRLSRRPGTLRPTTRGAATILALLNRENPHQTGSPVFGCPLLSPE